MRTRPSLGALQEAGSCLGGEAVEQLERDKKTSFWGYWLAVAVGFAIAFAYLAASCAFGEMC